MALSLAYLPTKIMQLTGLKRQICAFTLGSVTALALAPLHFFPLCFLTFPLLVLLLDGINTGKLSRQLALKALTGWSFGFGYFVSGLWWIGYLMFTDGAAFGLMMLPLSILGLPAMMASYYALAVLVQAFLCRDGFRRILALAIGFGLAEWLRAVLFTGFPWNAIGYTAMPSPLLMQIAAIFGLYGVNVLAVLIYATPLMLIDKKTCLFERLVGLGCGILATGLIVAFGMWRLSGLPVIEDMIEASGTRVRLVQPSIPQQDKIDDYLRFENFDRHVQLSKAAPERGHPLPDLIVWPETAVPYLLAYAPEAKDAIAQMLDSEQLALVGTVRAEPGADPQKPNYYNSLEIINAQGEIIGHADKAHLVPFGEYLPWPQFFELIGLHAAAQMTGGYSTASSHISLPLNEQVTILPLICYEAIFPTEMDYQGTKANLLLNISNDAWYGATPGPAQHFHQARLRTVEQGMPLIRSANNGISAVIDPYGRIITMLALNEVGFVDATIPSAIQPIWQGGPGMAQLLGLLAVLLVGIWGLKRFPKSGNRFLDKKRGETRIETQFLTHAPAADCEAQE